jgi:acetyl-CoA decarbonylase/synthase complex subunit delta
MPIQFPAEKSVGKIAEITIGATKAEGGTRNKKVFIGGENALPFLSADGAVPHPPAIAMEVYDIVPEYPEEVARALGPVLGKPAAWAKKCVDDLHADLICLKLRGTHPEAENRSAEQAAKTVHEVLNAVGVPVMVYGCGVEEKDTQVMQAIGEVLKAENCVIGLAENEKYKSLSVASMGFGQSIVAFSNLDINLAKQLNILLTDFGVKRERIIMDPLMGGLGYGLDYSYSVIERIRLAALAGDTMLQNPIVCDTSIAWNAREANTPELPVGGDVARRGPLWEATTAISSILAGADMVIMRHPEAVKHVRKALNDLSKGGA